MDLQAQQFWSEAKKMNNNPISLCKEHSGFHERVEE